MRLKTGEKVLDVHLNEYTSFAALEKDFFNMPKDMSTTGKFLSSTKSKALSNLEYQRNKFPGRMARQFYYKKVEYEGVNYYHINELVLD